MPRRASARNASETIGEELVMESPGEGRLAEYPGSGMVRKQTFWLSAASALNSVRLLDIL